MTHKNTYLEQNFHAIAAILRDFNLTKVLSSYGGSGDSGEIHEIQLFRGEEPDVESPDDMPEVTYSPLSFKHVEGQGYVDVFTKAVTTDFRTAICDLTEQAITLAGHPGWENNEGSDGYLTIYASGHAELEHENHFDDESDERTEVEFNDESAKVGPAIHVLAKALAKAGVQAALVHYSGSGNRRDPSTVVIEGAPSILDTVVTVKLPQYFFNWIKHREDSTEDEETLKFEKAMIAVSDEALRVSGHGRYEDGDGGGGTFTLKSDGTATLDHGTNCINSTTEKFSWNDPVESAEGAQ